MSSNYESLNTVIHAEENPLLAINSEDGIKSSSSTWILKNRKFAAILAAVCVVGIGFSSTSGSNINGSAMTADLLNCDPTDESPDPCDPITPDGCQKIDFCEQNYFFDRLTDVECHRLVPLINLDLFDGGNQICIKSLAAALYMFNDKYTVNTCYDAECETTGEASWACSGDDFDSFSLTCDGVDGECKLCKD